MSLAFYAVHIESRLVFEIRPIGEFLLIRPAARGREQEIAKLTMLQFDREFNHFIGRFLLPNRLTEEDYLEEF